MRLRITTAILAALVASGVLAQEDEEVPADALDLTMELMPEGATGPEAVTRVIELPGVAIEAAGEASGNAANGLDPANAVRDDLEAGLDRAEAAREAARGEPPEELGVPETAAPPDVPGDGPVDLPGPPDDLPTPPDAPGRPGD